VSETSIEKIMLHFWKDGSDQLNGPDFLTVRGPRIYGMRVKYISGTDTSGSERDVIRVGMTKPTAPRHPLVRVIDECIRLNSRLRTVFKDVTAMSGLAPMEHLVLTAVAGAQSPPTVPQIGRSLGHPRQVIQRAADSLIIAGLIQSSPNPDHKTARLLYPTDAGLALQKAIELRTDEAAEALSEAEDVKECEKLAHDMRVLRGKIEARLRKRDDET
jgi:DNA-binding MarR family transcriptional regulator